MAELNLHASAKEINHCRPTRRVPWRQACKCATRCSYVAPETLTGFEPSDVRSFDEAWRPVAKYETTPECSLSHGALESAGFLYS